jgi:hypothetical protein
MYLYSLQIKGDSHTHKKKILVTEQIDLFNSNISSWRPHIDVNTEHKKWAFLHPIRIMHSFRLRVRAKTDFRPKGESVLTLRSRGGTNICHVRETCDVPTTQSNMRAVNMNPSNMYTVTHLS